MQPSGLGVLVSMSRPHRKTVNDELQPLIEKRLATMTSGETIWLVSTVKAMRHGLAKGHRSQAHRRAETSASTLAHLPEARSRAKG